MDLKTYREQVSDILGRATIVYATPGYQSTSTGLGLTSPRRNRAHIGGGPRARLALISCPSRSVLGGWCYATITKHPKNRFSL